MINNFLNETEYLQATKGQLWATVKGSFWKELPCRTTDWEPCYQVRLVTYATNFGPQLKQVLAIPPIYLTTA